MGVADDSNEQGAHSGFDSWNAYWTAQGMPWRMEPEIARKRQLELSARCSRNKSRGSPEAHFDRPFRGVELSRGDIEWLFATYIPSKVFDLREAAISAIDLAGLDRSRLILHEGDFHKFRERGLHASANAATLGQTTDAAQELLRVYAAGRRNFVDCSLAGSQLSGAVLAAADFTRAILDGADLTRADLTGTTLKGALMRGVCLCAAKLKQASLEMAVLVNADLRGSELYQANLRGAQLHGAILTNANLYQVSLRDADLRGANFSGEDLRDAILDGANTSGAVFEGADLTGASRQPPGKVVFDDTKRGPPFTPHTPTI